MDIGGFAVEHRYENQMIKTWKSGANKLPVGTSLVLLPFIPVARADFLSGRYTIQRLLSTLPTKSMLYYDQLRYRLMPYIYAVAGAAYHKDYTIMRGLVMDFAADTTR